MSLPPKHADAAVSAWIAENCLKARDAVIDYNLIWPNIYNGHLQNMWTLIEVEDYRRAERQQRTTLLDESILLLPKNRTGAGVCSIVGTQPEAKVPSAILGNFFPDRPP